jgi:hypothetical protein
MEKRTQSTSLPVLSDVVTHVYNFGWQAAQVR